MQSQNEQTDSPSQYIENENLTIAKIINQQKIEECITKIGANSGHIQYAINRVEKLNELLLRYEILDRELTVDYYENNAKLQTALRYINCLKCVQYHREIALLKRLDAFDRGEFLENDQELFEQTMEEALVSGTAPSSYDFATNEDDCDCVYFKDHLLEAIKRNTDARIATLRKKLEAGDFNKTTIEHGRNLVKYFLGYRDVIKLVKQEYKDDAEYAENERQKFCLLKCKRINVEFHMLDERYLLKELIYCKQQLNETLRIKLDALYMERRELYKIELF